MSKGKHPGWTLLNTRRTADAFRIFHWQTFIREVHDIDPLVTNGSADIAGNTFRFLGENSKAREACIDMHEGSEWTKETAPNPSGIFEIEANANDSSEKHIDHPFVVNVIDQLACVIFSFE